MFKGDAGDFPQGLGPRANGNFLLMQDMLAQVRTISVGIFEPYIEMIDALFAKALDIGRFQGIVAAAVELGVGGTLALEVEVAIQSASGVETGCRHREIATALERLRHHQNTWIRPTREAGSSTSNRSIRKRRDQTRIFMNQAVELGKSVLGIAFRRPMHDTIDTGC